MLVVTREYSKLEHRLDSYSESMNSVVDIPLYGPQPLIDSLTIFINKHLFKAYNVSLDSNIYSEEELFHTDLRDIMSHYAEKYKPFRNLVFCGVDFHLLLIAQTESYVTYGLEYYHCSASCGSEFYCFTFSKKDGHLCKLIDNDKLSQYVEGKYNKETDYFTFPYRDSHDYSDCIDFGLLEDKVLEIHQEQAVNFYVADYTDIQELLPFLTDDAKALLNAKGDISKYGYETWSLGKQIGHIETLDGKTGTLMLQRPRWEFYGGENEIFYIENSEIEDNPIVTTYFDKDGKYTPIYDDVKTLLYIGITDDYLIRIDLIDTNLGIYQYSSWKFDDNITNTPDLVLTGSETIGYGGQLDCAYSFENEGYRYDVWVMIEPKLEIYKNGKLILKQSLQLFSVNDKSIY